MSRSVDLFIDADLTLDELARQLSEQIGVQLQRDPDRPQWVLEDGQTVARLSEHPYGDDADLLLSRYRYALSAAVANGARPLDTPAAALLRKLSQQLHSGTPWRVLLVVDLQYRESSGPPRQAAPAPAPAPDGNRQPGEAR